MMNYPFDFLSALKITLKFEGGLNNDPKDSGGLTNFGITQSVYNTYRNFKKKNLQSVELITPEEYKEIYYKNYWQAGYCYDSSFSSPLNYLHFDTCVNLGPKRGIMILQEAVGAVQDGVFGYETKSKIICKSYELSILDYVSSRKRFYVFLAQKKPEKYDCFLKGWIRRANYFLGLI